MNEPLLDRNIVTGRVTDVQTSTKFQTSASKLVSLIFDGEPVQLSRQTSKTTLFVEPVDAYSEGSLPGSQRALLFLGEIGGQVARGNIVQARVRRGRGGVLQVRELNNLTTSSSVRPAAQLGPLAVALLAASLCLCLAWLLGALLGAIADGSILNGAVSLAGAAVAAIAPILAMLVVIKLLLGLR